LRNPVLVPPDGEFGTFYGEGLEAGVEPVDAEVEASLQLLNAAEVKVKSYKSMKEGTSENDTADAHWQSKMIARLADTEAKAFIDDISVVSKGGGGNLDAAVRAHIKALCSEAGRACFKDKIAAAPLALRRGISTPTTTRNQRR
jgi:hypothetical protein